MISVQPYLEKLELLKEYMDMRIDNQPMDVWFNLQVCPDEYYINKQLPLPTPYKNTIRFGYSSFDEFLKHKTDK